MDMVVRWLCILGGLRVISERLHWVGMLGGLGG